MIELMKTNFLTGIVCKNYCQYYKPLKDEDIACMGLVVAGRLVEWGIPVPYTPGGAPRGEEDETGLPGENTSEQLRKQMCPACAFYENDCDFIAFHRLAASDTELVEATPCGGFLFLGRLIDGNSIDISDINQVL